MEKIRSSVIILSANTLNTKKFLAMEEYLTTSTKPKPSSQEMRAPKKPFGMIYQYYHHEKREKRGFINIVCGNERQ